MRCKAIVVIVALFLAVPAMAAEHTVIQKNLKFDQPMLTIKKGDKVFFVNKDGVTHNVFSATPNSEFNLGKFNPGSRKLVELGEVAVVDVECSIHPGMNMTIFILQNWRKKLDKAVSMVTE